MSYMKIIAIKKKTIAITITITTTTKITILIKAKIIITYMKIKDLSKKMNL